MDATITLKAEVKAWERDFRVQNGRNATIEDIKALPHIAEKYKLYKKLTKEAEAKSARERRTPESPKTPPRTKAKTKASNAVPPATILLKSRPVASTTDMATNNPFSPVKRKAGNAAASSSSADLGPNPFLTPLKAKRASPREVLSPSPGPSLAPAPAPTAISKARKRLRGEPVSPSPKPREKRRRLDALNPSGKGPSISRSPSPSSPSIEEGDSFVDDSPVKVPASGKAFKPLFEEANMRPMLPLSQPTGQKTNIEISAKLFTRAKTVPGGLFGGSKKVGKEARTLFNPEPFENDITEGDETLANGRRKGKDKELPIDGAQKSRKKRVLPGPKGLIPGKDDLFEAHPTETRPAPPRNTNTRKRSLSDATKDEKDVRTRSNAWNLLPPSPPPPDGNSWQKGKGKGKMKAKDTVKGKSKKAKLSLAESDEDMEEDRSSESAEIKIVSWRGRPQSPQLLDADDTALELDPEMQFHLRGRQAGGPAPKGMDKFEVDLPEEMRRVLALSPSDQGREREEEDLVKDLMQGQRKGRGEVWGPGEVGGEGNESDEGNIEDDWEGEGIPWEVAEL